MREEAVVEAFVPAAAVEVLVEALRYELALLEAAVISAEQAADGLERRVGGVPDREDDAALLRVAAFLDQLDAEGAARRRATLDEGQILADRRLVGGREEAEAILLGAESTPVVDAGDEARRRAGEDYFQELVDTMRAVGPRPVEQPVVEAVAPPGVPDAALGAATEPVVEHVPTIVPAAVPVPEAAAPAPVAPPATEIDDDDPGAEERFQRFWEPVAEVADARGQQRRLAAAVIVPFATLPLVLFALLLWAL